MAVEHRCGISSRSCSCPGTPFALVRLIISPFWFYKSLQHFEGGVRGSSHAVTRVFFWEIACWRANVSERILDHYQMETLVVELLDQLSSDPLEIALALIQCNHLLRHHPYPRLHLQSSRKYRSA